MFKTYKSMFRKDKVQTVDDSLCLIAGVGDITIDVSIVYDACFILYGSI
jgi:hypothetical protein